MKVDVNLTDSFGFHQLVFFQNPFVHVRGEGYSIGFVKFRLEFDPMQPKGVEEAFHNVHAEEDTNSYTKELSKSNEDRNRVEDQWPRGSHCCINRFLQKNK